MTPTPTPAHRSAIEAAVAAAQAQLTKQAPECTPESHALAFPPAHWLTEDEAWTVSGGYDDLAPGSRTMLKDSGDRANIGRARCGHLYLVTPESVDADLAKRSPAAVAYDLKKSI